MAEIQALQTAKASVSIFALRRRRLIGKAFNYEHLSIFAFRY